MAIFGKKRVYMDYASAPPVCQAALRAVRETEATCGNPGGIHHEAVLAQNSLASSRSSIASHLAVKSREIVFTSGLTESNNLAILGFARLLERKRRSLQGTHWLVSAIEHTSVLDVFGEVERLGGLVSHILPNEKGIISPDEIARHLRPETVLISIGWSNNETGMIQPLSKIRQTISLHEMKHSTEVILHSDAGQAPLYLPDTAHTLGVDILSIGSNKLYGPHGIGCLYIGSRCDISRVAYGGPQERKLRPGTESVALAAGFAAAYSDIVLKRQSESERLRRIRDDMFARIKQSVPGAEVNGDLRHGLPHILNISIPNIQSEYVALALDRDGIAISTKSACREGEESESHVVSAMTPESWRASNTLRFSLGAATSAKDAIRAADSLAQIVNKHA